jgi:uncharacterized protein YsxB (DUF464 family)
VIEAFIRRNKKGDICGFKVLNHGESIVCAAVSILTLNTANSIEALTDEKFSCDHNPEGGYLEMDFPDMRKGCGTPQAGLLLKSLELGLRSVMKSYENELVIEDDEDD